MRAAAAAAVAAAAEAAAKEASAEGFMNYGRYCYYWYVLSAAVTMVITLPLLFLL